MSRRPLLLLMVSVVFLGLLGASCDRSGREPDPRVETLEKSVARMTTQVEETLGQLEAKDKIVEDDLAAIKTSLADISAALDGIRTDVSAVKAADASLTKKIDDLTKKVNDVSTKVGAVDQRIWVLESRYGDHLRKYHGGG